MFDSLADHLQTAFKTIRGVGQLTPENIEEAIRQVRQSLLEADVSLIVVKLFISRVRQKALGTEVLNSVSPQQQFIKVVHDELVTILGGENVPLNLSKTPNIVMLTGLQGSGKTTASGKLALKLKTDGFKPLLVALDIQRPAAIAQLETLGRQIDVPVFARQSEHDVFDIAKQALAEAEKLGLNPVIFDTAGRLQIDTQLMAEVLMLDRAFEPVEKLLVVDAMTGQQAVDVANAFNTQLAVTGIILTKIDGDARGGAALSVAEAVGKPIKFISTGEKLDALEPFHPDRMASRILGMGDVVTLVEKAKQSIDEKEAQKVANQMMAGEFTLEMFVNTQRMMKKMGSFGDIMKMMGVGGMFGINANQQEQLASHSQAMFSRYETAINSMTVKERRKPELIDMSRRRRIAQGSGLKENEIGQMLKEFEQMRAMFGQFAKMLPGMAGLAGPGGLGQMSQLDAAKLAARMPKASPPKLAAPSASGFPFGGPGGGYYRKKKR